MKIRTRILVAEWDEAKEAYSLDGWVSRDGEWWVQPVGHDEWPTP
jgi:hypothetical protein